MLPFLVNRHYDTNPLIVHAPGDVSYPAWEILKTIIERLPAGGDDTPDLDIFTFNSGAVSAHFPTYAKPMGLTERQLDRYGCKYHVLGRGHHKWHFWLKVEDVVQAMLNSTKKYVLTIDSGDILFFAHPAQVLERFKQMKCKLLYCGEMVSWPPYMQDGLFPPPYVSLNNGAWIGEREFALEALGPLRWNSDESQLLVKTGVITASDATSDQVQVKLALRKHFPMLTVDYRCEIFQPLGKESRVDGVEWGVRVE